MSCPFLEGSCAPGTPCPTGTLTIGPRRRPAAREVGRWREPGPCCAPVPCRLAPSVQQTLLELRREWQGGELTWKRRRPRFSTVRFQAPVPFLKRSGVPGLLRSAGDAEHWLVNGEFSSSGEIRLFWWIKGHGLRRPTDPFYRQGSEGQRGEDACRRSPRLTLKSSPWTDVALLAMPDREIGPAVFAF